MVDINCTLGFIPRCTRARSGECFGKRCMRVKQLPVQRKGPERELGLPDVLSLTPHGLVMTGGSSARTEKYEKVRFSV